MVEVNLFNFNLSIIICNCNSLILKRKLREKISSRMFIEFMLERSEMVYPFYTSKFKRGNEA